MVKQIQERREGEVKGHEGACSVSAVEDTVFATLSFYDRKLFGSYSCHLMLLGIILETGSQSSDWERTAEFTKLIKMSVTAVFKKG